MTKSRRVGKFTIDTALIERAVENHHGPDAAKLNALFSQVIIVRADYSWGDIAIEYQAYSPKFKEVELGESAPRYLLEFTSHSGFVGHEEVTTYEANFHPA